MRTPQTTVWEPSQEAPPKRAAVPRLPCNRQACDNRDARRFDAFYANHVDWVFRLCLRLSGNRYAEAEDAAQEAMLAAFQALPRFTGKAKVTTWLYTITVRTVRKRVERGEPAALSLSEEAVASAVSAQQARVALAEQRSGTNEDAEFHLCVSAALAELPLPLREAFVLVKAEGFTHKEAARILEIPQGTVQARVHEAARRLRARLSEEELV